MAGWLGKSLSVVATFLVTWGVMITYWRSSGRVPSSMEMLAWLGLAPIGISGGGFLLRNALYSGANRVMSAEISLGGDASSGSTMPAGVPPLQSPLAVVQAGQLNLGIGMDAESLVANAATMPLPALQETYRDARNLPVRASVAVGLDDQVVLGMSQDGIVTRQYERRAMALLQPVLDDMLANAVARLPAVDLGEEVVVAGLRRHRAQVVSQILTIELLLPSQWNDALRHWAQQWLHEQALQAGLDVRQFEVLVRPVSAPGEAWDALQHAAEGVAAASPRWHLLLATASCIDPDLIAEWDASGRLATSVRTQGDVPGEGAAGLLLASPAAVAPSDAWVWSPLCMGRSTQVAAGAARTRQQLQAALQTWWQAAAQPAESLQFAVHDGNFSGTEMVTAATLAASLNPDLDVVQHGLPLRACAGVLEGGVLPLAQMVAALAHVQTHSSSALLLGLSQPESVRAALVSPFSSFIPAPTAGA